MTIECTGTEKAAILMLTLGRSEVAELFGRLDLDEVKELSQTMALLGQVDNAMIEGVLREFKGKLCGMEGVKGGFDSTEQVLGRFMEPEQVTQIMQEIRGPSGRTVWDKLGNVNETVLASFLKNEYPQTVAVVLSRIDSAHAARVLGCLPEDFALEVVLRMLNMELVQKNILEDVERTLRTEFMTNLARTTQRDNHEAMAEIFNYFDRSTEARMMGSLESHDKDAADRIRALMFTFEDLVKLNASGVQTLLRNAGNNRIGLALKGGSEAVKDLFFSNMSERAAKILREDMEAMGGVRGKDVEEAQQAIVNMAKQLAAVGEITLSDAKDGDLVY